MDLTVDSIKVGIVVSVVTELLKMIPWLNKSSLTKALTSIVVTIAAVFVWEGGSITDWNQAFLLFVQALIIAFATYKIVVQPVAQEAGLKTQK